MTELPPVETITGFLALAIFSSGTTFEIVGWFPVVPYTSLSNTTWIKFFGFNAPTVANVPMPISTLPSPSNTTTCLFGLASATPSAMAGAFPMDPII